MDTLQPHWANCFSVWPLLQLKNIFPHLNWISCISIRALCLIPSLGTSGNRTGSALPVLGHQVFTDIDNIPPEPSLLRAKESAVSASSYVREAAALEPPLWEWALRVCLLLESPTLGTAFQMCPASAEGKRRILALILPLKLPCFHFWHLIGFLRLMKTH